MEEYITVNPEESLLIFSDPRGGSTWLAQMLRTIANTSLIWEPLNIADDSPFRRLGFGWRQFIPEDEPWPEAREEFRNLFNGRGLTRTTTFGESGSLNNYRHADQLIFKFVNGNAMLPWITRSSRFKYKPIYLIRHPYAVVASQIHHGGWSHIKEGFRIPPMRHNELYLLHKPFLDTLKTLEEVNLAVWCLTNLSSLRNPRNNKDWITLNYENLVVNTEKEMQKVFNAWGFQPPPAMRAKFKEPSITVRGLSPIEGKAQVCLWEDKFDMETSTRMGHIMEYFGVEFYTPNDPWPKISF